MSEAEKLARSEISSKLKEWLLLVDAQHLRTLNM